jgi:hypothetical protein
LVGYTRPEGLADAAEAVQIAAAEKATGDVAKAWLIHLEEVAAGQRRIGRWSKWRPPAPGSQDVPPKDD